VEYVLTRDGADYMYPAYSYSDYQTLQVPVAPLVYHNETIAHTWVFAVRTNSSATFRLQARRWENPNSGFILALAGITTITAPFGQTIAIP